MKIVIQRVKSASVTVGGEVISQIGKGLCLLVGISTEDTSTDVEKAANKILKLKLFEDLSQAAETPTGWEGKPWMQSVCDIPGGEILSVSQFTLYGSVKKGAKPDFHKAQKGELSIKLYNEFLERLSRGLPSGAVKDGEFGALMDVAVVNDGPVTIVYET